MAKGLQPNLKPPQFKIGADTGQITEAKDTSGEKESRFKYTDLNPTLLKRQQVNERKRAGSCDSRRQGDDPLVKKSSTGRSGEGASSRTGARLAAERGAPR